MTGGFVLLEDEDPSSEEMSMVLFFGARRAEEPEARSLPLDCRDPRRVVLEEASRWRPRVRATVERLRDRAEDLLV